LYAFLHGVLYDTVNKLDKLGVFAHTQVQVDALKMVGLPGFLGTRVAFPIVVVVLAVICAVQSAGYGFCSSFVWCSQHSQPTPNRSVVVTIAVVVVTVVLDAVVLVVVAVVAAAVLVVTPK